MLVAGGAREEFMNEIELRQREFSRSQDLEVFSYVGIRKEIKGRRTG